MPRSTAQGCSLRLVLTWVLSTGVPLLLIVLSIAASKFSLLDSSAEGLFTPILLMAIAALSVLRGLWSLSAATASALG